MTAGEQAGEHKVLPYRMDEITAWRVSCTDRDVALYSYYT